MNTKIVSPCINICQMNPTTGLCAGCFRTLDEIARWSVMTQQDRAKIMNALLDRKAALGNRGNAVLPK